jgi:hypothetical protein
MSTQTTARKPGSPPRDQTPQDLHAKQQHKLAQTLATQGYDFVSVSGSGAVEIVAARWMESRRFSLGLVLQPPLQQFTTLLAYAFGQLGLDAVIVVAPDLLSLEQVAVQLRDQTPAGWSGKVGVVTTAALQLLFTRNP